MNDENYKSVAAIEAECFTQPWSEETFFEELSNPNAHTYLALDDGKAAGFLSVWEVCGEVSVNNIAVRDEFRRKGIARALLQTMLDELSPAYSVTLEVRKSNAAAIALYESFGFERVGERKDFYSLPTENALLYTKILNGEN
jgi:ribosomal-protein-alanine N-acetyltransferase